MPKKSAYNGIVYYDRPTSDESRWKTGRCSSEDLGQSSQLLLGGLLFVSCRTGILLPSRPSRLYYFPLCEIVLSIHFDVVLCQNNGVIPISEIAPFG